MPLCSEQALSDGKRLANTLDNTIEMKATISHVVKRAAAIAALLTCSVAPSALKAQTESTTRNHYRPSAEVIESQKEFAADRFGIFLHWGIYSMFAQGEWYLNYGPLHSEYSKAAGGFYPAQFDAHQWVAAIKDAGAKYICFTTRHHDGFSMFDTKESDYDIVDATPFKRDILKELADECHKQGIALHLYYSHLDWGREDYPQGRTGHTTGRDSLRADWPKYRQFMDRQLTELLTNYGPIRCIWFDGWWDHDEDPEPFDWQLPEQYALVHSLQPGCLVANNHHQTPFEGEDIQIFERDLPGENTAGLSGQNISALPLETCNTMNGMWGYKVKDTNYKDTSTLVRYLVRAASMGANLLLNIGPRPDGQLPDQSLERLKEIGVWMRANGETVYGTQAGDFKETDWGVATRKENRLFLHIFSPSSTDIEVPVAVKVRSAKEFATGKKVKFTRNNDKSITLHFDTIPTTADSIDFIVELDTEIPQ